MTRDTLLGFQPPLLSPAVLTLQLLTQSAQHAVVIYEQFCVQSNERVSTQVSHETRSLHDAI